MKRLSAILMCLILVLSMTAIAVSAAGDDRTITINNGKDGETYTAYKIFDVTYDTGKTSYSYTIKGDSEWFGVVTNSQTNPAAASFIANGLKFTPIATSGTPVVYNVEKDTGFDSATFAALLYANVTGKTAAGSVTYDKTDSDKQAISVTGTGDGYYFVTTSAGALCALNTSNPTIAIDEKNPDNTVDKDVKEDSDEQYYKSNDAQIGDTINYQTTVNIVKGAENLVLYDKMTAGLTPNVSSVAISYRDTETDTEVSLNKKDSDAHATDYNYEVEAVTADNGFKVTFNQTYLDSLTAATTTLKVTYTAVLNENAVVRGNGNVNETYLTYGNAQTTESKKTTTYTYDFSVIKTDNAATPAKLAGAEFQLLLNNQPMEFVYDSANGVYRAATSSDDDEDKVTTITTPANGTIKFSGLDADTYVLKETKAPAGYNKLPQTITVKISGETGSTMVVETPADAEAGTLAAYFDRGVVFQLSDGQTATLSDPSGANKKDPAEIQVKNAKGGLLPTTGGWGTTIFYTVGGILVVGAVILLISRKRMRKSA